MRIFIFWKSQKERYELIMKKFKKFIALSTAAMAAVSAMSMTAFAAEDVTYNTTSCKVYVSGNAGETTVRTMEIDVPSNLTENEEKAYISAAAQENVGLAFSDNSNENSGIMPLAASGTLSGTFTKNSFNIIKYDQVNSTNAAVFSNYALANNYDSLEVYIKKTSGAVKHVNARLNWTHKTTSSNSGVAAETNEELDLNDTDVTIWFINGDTSEMDDIVLNTNYLYSLYISGYDGAGRANITVTPHVYN